MTGPASCIGACVGSCIGGIVLRASAARGRVRLTAVAAFLGRYLRAASLGAAFLLAGEPAKAQVRASADGVTTASEDRVKAASVYKFLNYVDWPAAAFARPETPYVIGVLHADDVAADLGSLVATRSVNNRPIVVRQLRQGEALTGIHVLFVGRSERAALAQISKQLQQQPVLLVTETEGALQSGSMINFRLVDERMRFEVALDAVDKAGLKLNSRLLAVAINVVKAAP